MAAQLGALDVAVMVVLLGLTLAKGLWVSWRINKKDKEDGNGLTPEQFFLAGRCMPWWAVGMSIFASNIGCKHFVGQAGAAAASGMPVSVYEWSAGLLIFFLGFGLAPTYLRLNLTTMPEWFERRFNANCRLLIAGISIVAYVLTKISASIFAGAVLFEVVLGVSMWASAPVILFVTSAYAASGGLSAVMYTDVGQGLIFILGGLGGLCYALSEIGGVSGLTDTLEANGLGYFMTTLRPADRQGYPWTGLLIGQPIASMWYWCIDQTLVQRVFSAKGLSHAQGGCALAGYLKILPPFLMVIPGMIARCFFEECQRTSGVLYPEWCETNLSHGQESNKAYPLLIIKTFPDGLRGLMIVSMILAMMSSLDSVFNCVSTVFTVDVYVRFVNPAASPRRQVWVGRLVTVLSAICGMAWLPMIANSADGMYLATQSAMSHLSPTLVAVFLLGLLWPRATGKGALAGLLVGFSFGIGRFIVREQTVCSDEDWTSFSCMDFNHMVLIIFAVALGVTVVASLLTEAPDPRSLQDTCARAARSAHPKVRADCRDAQPLSPTARATGPSENSICDAAAAQDRMSRASANPVVSQMLLASGVMLLGVMLVLCVGFGYAGDPVAGTEATVSGGTLAIAGVAGAALLVHVGMGAASFSGTAAAKREETFASEAGRTENSSTSDAAGL